MPSRTAYAGTALTGDVYTAANHARMPGGWIGYAEVTADQALQDADSGGLKTDLTGLSIAVTVGATRRIRVTGSAVFAIDDPLANPSLIAYIQEGATILAPFAVWDLNAASGLIFDRASLSFERSVILTPSAGAHTYKLTAWATAGADMILDASAAQPAYILVEDLGPAT